MAAMRPRTPGRSDLAVGEIGSGALPLARDEREATRSLHRAVALGVTPVDTADLYDRGLDEEIVDRALRSVSSWTRPLPAFRCRATR